jgi:hypothetical protein
VSAGGGGGGGGLVFDKDGICSVRAYNVGRMRNCITPLAMKSGDVLGEKTIVGDGEMVFFVCNTSTIARVVTKVAKLSWFNGAIPGNPNSPDVIRVCNEHGGKIPVMPEQSENLQVLAFVRKTDAGEYVSHGEPLCWNRESLEGIKALK